MCACNELMKRITVALFERQTHLVHTYCTYIHAPPTCPAHPLLTVCPAVLCHPVWQVWVAAVKASTAFIVYQEEEKTKQFFSDLLPQILEVCLLWRGEGCRHVDMDVDVCVCVCGVGVSMYVRASPCVYVCFVHVFYVCLPCFCSLSRRPCRRLRTMIFCSV